MRVTIAFTLVVLVAALSVLVLADETTHTVRFVSLPLCLPPPYYVASFVCLPECACARPDVDTHPPPPFPARLCPPSHALVRVPVCT